MSRQWSFRKLLETENRKQNALSDAIRKNKQATKERVLVHQPDVRGDEKVCDGAYTSSILNGMTSDEVAKYLEEKVEKVKNARLFSSSPKGSGEKRKVDERFISSKQIESCSLFSSRIQTGRNQSESTSSSRRKISHNQSSTSSRVMTESDVDCYEVDNQIIEPNVDASDEDIPDRLHQHTHILELPPDEIGRNILMEMKGTVSVNETFGYIHSEVEVALIKLASIVTQVNAPHFVYKSLVDWAKTTSDRSVLSTRTISYKLLVKNLASKYGIPNIFPETKQILLPSMNAVSVTTFSFVDQLYSLLSDKELMQPKNLIYGHNIFERINDHTPDHLFNDVESSTWFLNTQRSMCVNAKDILCPLIIYIDKTYVRSKGAEPISFTLGLWRRNIRSTPAAWRNLGMIPGKLGSLIPNKKFPVASLGEMRLNDWHFVANHILSGLKLAQLQDGLKWQIDEKDCILRIPIMFIIGDIEGHDKICSRKSGHSKKMKAVTHSCKVRRHECGDPNTDCVFFSSHEIKSKQDICQGILNGTEDEKDMAKANLKKYGFYDNVQNAFFDLDYGSSSYGTHGACAICLLHTFKQKFPNSVLEQYLMTFGTTTSTKGCHMINRSLPKLIKQSMRQSDRNFPRLNTFTESLLHAKFQINANEKYARMFALSMFLMTTYGWELSFSNEVSKEVDPGIVRRRIDLVQKTLFIYKFLVQENFPKTLIHLGKNKVRKYMSLYKEVAEWKGTNDHESEDTVEDDITEELEVIGEEEILNEAALVTAEDKCTFPKFHYLVHVLSQIERFGSALNFDGGSCESNHKYLTKAPGTRTQGRLDTFDAQTSFNLSAKIVLDKAFRYLNFDTSFGVSNTLNAMTDEGEQCTPGIVIHTHSSHFYVFDSDEGSQITWKLGLVSPKEEFPKLAIEALHRHIVVPGWEQSVITGFTCLNWNGNIIRAHPSYRSGKHWYDYVNVNWEGMRGQIPVNYTCPARVYMFLNIYNHPIIGNGMYAIVHSTAVCGRNPLRPTLPARTIWNSRGKSDMFRFWEKEKTCQCIPVASIQSLAFVYKDFSDEDMTKQTGYVIEAKPMSEWVAQMNSP